MKEFERIEYSIIVAFAKQNFAKYRRLARNAYLKKKSLIYGI